MAAKLEALAAAAARVSARSCSRKRMKSTKSLDLGDALVGQRRDLPNQRFGIGRQGFPRAALHRDYSAGIAGGLVCTRRKQR
jgi:hypothetical protein